MCVNQRYITNIYTHKGLYVKCGNCPSCQQEKAIHRVSRIKDTYTPGNECMMVGLTYSRHTAPYIDRSEAFNFSRGRIPYLNVYRDRSFRRVRIDKEYNFDYRFKDRRHIVDSVPFSRHCRFDKLKDLKFEQGKIGICFYPDVQHFIARLRLNLHRLYNYDKPFKTYVCSEYGTKSFRPHLHVLFFYEKGDFETLRSAIFKSWPFSDLSRFDRSVEKCFRGASYVASYVNLGSKFPDFLKTYFRPKHSYSKGFGLGNAHFTLRSVLDMYDKGSLSYTHIDTNKTAAVAVPRIVPAYVIHRYFPKFKGYSRIAPSSLPYVMQRLGRCSTDEVNEAIKPLYLSDQEVYQISVKLHNAFMRCHDELPGRFETFDSYYRFHNLIWRLHSSEVLKHQMLDESVPLAYHFTNLDVIKAKIDRFEMDYPPGLTEKDFSILDPNEFPHEVSRSLKLESDYHTNIKHRSVTNMVLSSLYEEW